MVVRIETKTVNLCQWKLFRSGRKTIDHGTILNATKANVKMTNTEILSKTHLI